MPAPPHSPLLAIIAGPNGAGKSTVAPELLAHAWGITEFLNADTIAAALNPAQPNQAALAAGKQMLRRFDEFAEQRISFALETTLASRTLAPRIESLLRNGYRVHIAFIALPSDDVAVERVRARVAAGGHDVPEATIRRRYTAGLRNFFQVYSHLADTWRLYDNTNGQLLIAAGERHTVNVVHDVNRWDALRAALQP